MKLSLTQENLNKALSVAGRMVGSRSALPVLGNVLLSTDSNRLKLSATNLEIGVNYWIGAKVDEEGSITVPARLLSEYVANLPPNTIKLAVAKQSLTVESDHYNSVINGIDAEEFPSIPVINKEPELSLPATLLKQALSQVVIVASSDDARPVLSGVYFYSEEDWLYIVATDSFRLAEKKVKLAKAPAVPIQLLVPSRTIQELLRIIDESEMTVEIAVEENQVMFKYGSVELVSRLIDGQFPNYRQLIPSDTQTTFKIDVAEFSNLAKVAGLFARENAGSVTLRVDSKLKTVSLRSIASQVGENTSEASATIEGEDAEVALNCRYITDALSVIKADTVSFSVTGKINPCLLRPVGADDYLHVIMPLRS